MNWDEVTNQWKTNPDVAKKATWIIETPRDTTPQQAQTLVNGAMYKEIMDKFAEVNQQLELLQRSLQPQMEYLVRHRQDKQNKARERARPYPKLTDPLPPKKKSSSLLDTPLVPQSFPLSSSPMIHGQGIDPPYTQEGVEDVDFSQ